MIVVSRRTLQPQSGLVVNRRHEITRGLCFLAVGSDFAQRNLVTGENASLASDIGYSVGYPGRAIYAGGNTKAASWPGTLTSSDGSGTGAFTMLSYTAAVSEAASCTLLSQSQGNGGPYALLSANMNSSYLGSAGKLSLDISGAQYILDGVVDGLPHVYLAMRTANERILERDGVVQGSTTGSTTNLGTATSSQIYASGINGYTGSSYTRSYPHFLQAIWNRALTPSERLLVGTNPWILVRQPRRDLYVSTAAAATTSSVFGRAFPRPILNF